MIANCPACGSDNTSERCEVDEFIIAFEGLPQLKASVPVTYCRDCKFRSTDHRAELIRSAIYTAFAVNWSETINEDKQ